MGRRQISEAVQAHLRGFTERNRERAAKRRQQLATSLSGDLPKVKQALCMDCYIALPTAMQKALWSRVGAGFEEAYAAVKAWLLRDD
jgi:hypothetical protein